MLCSRICNFLAGKKINILDISQTIVSGYFNMMMVVDVTLMEEKFSDVADELSAFGKDEIGVQIKMQREEIFDSMHRI